MIEHGKVESTVQPQALTIDDYSVWVAKDIEQVKTEEFEAIGIA